MSTDPIKYTVRESLRSRRIWLRVTPQKGLVVVVPRGYSRSRIAPILDRKQDWIRSALARVEAHRERFVPAAAWQVPERIEFPAFKRSWQVEMHPGETGRVTVREHGDGLLRVRGNAWQTADCRVALQRWLLRQGRKHLAPLLYEMSRQTGQSFNRVKVRRQRTRWGSCSRRKSVSLNAKLLFLDPSLVRYVMIHELCHTREMNHSRGFWRLVQAECPDFRALNKILRQAWKNLPAWAKDA